jgi:hypothetical protein
MSRSGRAAIGVSIDASRVVASELALDAAGSTSAFTRAWDSTSATRGAALATIFRELRAAAPAATSLHIALLPPLAELRIVALPPLDADELRSAVAGDLRSYFPFGEGPHLLQVHAADEAEAPTARPITVAAKRLVGDVLDAATTAGWRVRSIAAAHLAWAAAARTSARTNGRVTGRVTGGVAGRDGTDLWVRVRTLGREDTLRVGPSGIRALRRSAFPSASADGAVVLAPDAEEAMVLAAAHAARADADSLWPETVYAARLRRVWRQVRAFALASAALLALAAGLEWQSLRRAEGRVAAARAALQPVVAEALARRDTLLRLEEALHQLQRFETDVPRWLWLLAVVDAALPGDASLLSLRGTGDTLVLIGEGERAAPALDALGRIPALGAVRVDAPIQQRVDEGEVVAERFTLLVRLRPSPDSR